MQTNARHVSPAVGEFAVTEMARLKEENSQLRMDLDALFDELHMMERNDSKIPAPIARWWERVTERQFAALAEKRA